MPNTAPVANKIRESVRASKVHVVLRISDALLFWKLYALKPGRQPGWKPICHEQPCELRLSPAASQKS